MKLIFAETVAKNRGIQWIKVANENSVSVKLSSQSFSAHFASTELQEASQLLLLKSPQLI